MKRTLTGALVLSLVSLISFTSAQTQESYPTNPDSERHEGVPKGEVLKFTFEKSKIFPGTWREYWVYVPSQYTPDKPACLYVNQDGIQYEAPTVFDNLINKKEMPVTIGVFVMHGRVRALNADSALDRFNRSFEYDGLGDNYVRFLIEELLPDVETKKTSDGRAIRLSKNASDRAIGGASSGAICAFTAAWERPDQFSRVFSSIGTYVGLRGGERYSTLIRKYEPKPIRVFLQDGSSDLNIYAGDWWMANQTMERALIFAGYEVQHVWGEGAHNQKHATAVFPDAMRWLWKGWPSPVGSGQSKNQTLSDILIPGEGWQVAGEGYNAAQALATGVKGEVPFSDPPNNKAYKIDSDGKVNPSSTSPAKAISQAFEARPSAANASGALVAIGGDDKIALYDGNRSPSLIAQGLGARDLVPTHNGNLYVVAVSGSTSRERSKVWLIKPNEPRKLVDTGLLSASGIAVSPDQSLLYVADELTHWVYSYQIQPDGSLQSKQRYYWLHCPDSEEGSGARAMRVDRDGRLYVATTLGIQVCDQAGRVNAILPIPSGIATSLCFGGPNFSTLFVTAGDKVYKRKLRAIGAQPWAPPLKPTAPRL